MHKRGFMGSVPTSSDGERLHDEGHDVDVYHRCRANMASIRQSRPDSGLGFQVKALKNFLVVPSSLERGTSGDRVRARPPTLVGG